jgi:diguanylate cyclase (GGDEF)-like protein
MRFEIAGLCFTDAQGTAFHHDLSLVVLSYLIAAGGSYAALEMVERWRSARGTKAYLWQATSAATLGGSIWSMHFIAILALRIGLPLTYAPGMTLFSLLIAIGVVGCGLQIVSAGASSVRICLAGIVVGLGVGAMHYVGMGALRFSGSLAYTPGFWSLSLLVGIAAAIVALWLSLTLQETWQRAAGALVMGVAICGMHYTGMAATVFQGDSGAPVILGLPSGPLAAAVALTTLALLLSALIFVAADRRLWASSMREAEALRRSNDQLAQAHAGSELSHQHLRGVLDNMTQGVCFFDSAHRLVVWNQRYAAIYNLPPGALRVGSSLEEVVDHRYAAEDTPEISRSEYLARLSQTVNSNQPSSSIVTLSDGRVVSVSHQPMADGGWVATHEDITLRQQAEARIVFMARHDALTRLPNRVLFQERLEQAIDLLGRGTGCAILCLDLDHFKLVNDTLGHPIGDGLLQAAAERLQACVREVDTLARLGGDEFAIIQLGLERPEDAALLAGRILTAFSEPFQIDGHQIVIGASVGVAMAPADGTLAEKLLKHADIALYLAKTEGRNMVRFFEPHMDARIQQRRMLELDLRGAIIRNEFELYYQPLVDLDVDTVTGFEALLRWNHPVRGLISPAEFIPLAEETGMIVAIGEWALRTACSEATTWPAHITLAVNLSPVQFKKGNLVSIVKAALAASGLPANRLELEITESVLLQDTVGTLAALHELRGMGVAVALDDFGTGFSSLSYLRNFPFDKIKIDQSFVRDLVKDREAIAIIRAVTSLGHNLRMKTTAEGVETVEQLNTLREEGCTEVQGYFFSHPKPASELPSLLESLRIRGNESANARLTSRRVAPVFSGDTRRRL